MSDKNRKWLLAARPAGIVGPEHFEWVEDSVPSVSEGEFLVRNRWLSCDPAQRTYMEFDSYIPAVKVGEVMVGASAGEVVALHQSGIGFTHSATGPIRPIADSSMSSAYRAGGSTWSAMSIRPRLPLQGAEFRGWWRG